MMFCTMHGSERIGRHWTANHSATAASGTSLAVSLPATDFADAWPAAVNRIIEREQNLSPWVDSAEFDLMELAARRKAQHG